MSRRDLAQLFKFPISIMSTVSAATGFVAFTHALTWRFTKLASAGGIGSRGFRFRLRTSGSCVSFSSIASMLVLPGRSAPSLRLARD